MRSHSQAALIVVGHGSTVNPDSSAPTLDLVDELRRRGLFAEVEPSFWKEEPSLRQAFHTVQASEIYVVPNFISEGYFTRTVIPRELELDGPLTRRGTRIIKYCEPVGSHPGVTELLLRRAAEVAPGVPPRETALFIVGHGTDLNDNSAAAAKREVELIAQRGLYAEVRNAYMEEAPLIANWDQLTAQPNVVVVPFFIADGLHSYQDIPVLLGIEAETGAAASQRSIFRRNPHHLRGRALYYASAIGTEPRFAELIVEQVAAFDAASEREEIADSLSAKSAIPARDFRIGQILVRQQGGACELRHEDDAETENLSLFSGPEEARRLAALDEAGQFRPLKTAPNLRRGWRLQLSSAEELRRALDHFYPAMAGVAQAVETGKLAAVPLRETLARQSGMYAVTRKISDAQAQETIGAFCRSDTGCLKRLLWPISPGSPVITLPSEKLSRRAPADELPLLCHEACNLLVAKIREVVKAAPVG